MTDVVRPPVRGDIRFNHPFLEPRARGTSHYGTDFGAQKPGVTGDEIVAPVDGTLVHQYRSPSFGNTSVIERNNGDGTYSYFVAAHQSGYAAKYRLSPQNPAMPVKTGDAIGYMGNTGTSSLGEPIKVHGHMEQINTDGRVDFSHGWPFVSKDRKPSGVTNSGVGWRKVGSSFQLPNGWVATSDNGRFSVTVPSGFGSSTSNGQRPLDSNVGAPANPTEPPEPNPDSSTPITPADRIRNGFDAIGPRGVIGPPTRPPVPFLNPTQENPLGGGMSGWGASTTGPFAKDTNIGAPPAGSQAPGRALPRITDPIGDGNGIGDWRSNLAAPAPSIIDPASVRRLSSPLLGIVPVDPNQLSRDAGPFAAPPSLPSPSSRRSALETLLAPDARPIADGSSSPLPFRYPQTLDAASGLPNLSMQAGAPASCNADRPTTGGLLALLQDYMRNYPDSASNR